VRDMVLKRREQTPASELDVTVRADATRATAPDELRASETLVATLPHSPNTGSARLQE